MVGLSSSTLSLSSYVSVELWYSLLPVATQMFPCRVDGGCGSSHPYRTLVVTGRTGDDVSRWGCSVLRGRNHQAVVIAAISGNAPETDDDGAIVQRKGDPLQLGGRIGAWRVDRLVEQYGSGGEVQADQMVGGYRRGCLVGYHEEFRAAVSITGVPVMPTVGVMSPHGRLEAVTGVARRLDQST